MEQTTNTITPVYTLICPYCGSNKWEFKRTVTVELHIDTDNTTVSFSENRGITFEEIRCGLCSRKATTVVHKRIKDQYALYTSESEQEQTILRQTSSS